MPANDQVKELSARLKAFALMLRFGHDLFAAKSFTDAAALAVNNSRVLLNFRGSSIVEVTDGRASVAAQYGQVSANAHSRRAVLECTLCERLAFEGDSIVLTPEGDPPAGVPAGVLPELLGADGALLVFALAAPPETPAGTTRLYWLLEYEKEVPSYAQTSARLLAASAAEALFYRRLCVNPIGLRLKRRFGGRKLFWLIVLIAVAGSMFLRVPESANAEFELKAPEITSVYAWFDGPIAACRFQDGAQVRKGDVVAEYDTSQLAYRLASAENTVRETQAELELESRSAFTERERLGKLKLLEARLESAKVAVEEMKWYLAHSRLIAPADGVLALADGRAELLTGKAVRTGDRIFDIYGGDGMVAEIPVNERDASVLAGTPGVTLFLHTAPEQPIPAQILEIPPQPELTEQRTYCYSVRAGLPSGDSGLRYGMRGIAKLSGEKVSLGYCLFKSAVLYLRRF